MLLLLRRLKHGHFMSAHFRKYLGYALGEMALVVIGILIALQIDNWNEERKAQTTLDSYLEAIARNMREDLAELETARAQRLEVVEAGATFGEHLPQDPHYEVEEIFYLDYFLSMSQRRVFFHANTSGFEALKNSGVLDRLQGQGIDRLLSTYYDLIRQIESLEPIVAEKIQTLFMEADRGRPVDVENWAWVNPSALPPARFEALQPVYRARINRPEIGSLWIALFEHAPLIVLYDSLNVIGEAFIQAVERGSLQAGTGVPRTPLDDRRDGLGYADIVKDGQSQWQAYFMGRASDVRLTDFTRANDAFRLDSIQRRGDALHIDFRGGVEWAAVYWSPMMDPSVTGRPHLDFSRFSRVRLELKGDEGGESINVHVKDADDPDDVPPAHIDLQLTDDWQTYEFDLEQFAPTDFSRLHIVLGFGLVPGDEPRSFSVRNIRYE